MCEFIGDAAALERSLAAANVTLQRWVTEADSKTLLATMAKSGKGAVVDLHRRILTSCLLINRRKDSDETKGNGRRRHDVNDVGHMLYRSEF